MRCVNCGYDNGDGRTACIKCGQPLQAFEQPIYSSFSQSDMLGGTVIGQSIEKNIPRPTVVIGSNQAISQQERKTVVLRAQTEQKTQLISSTPCHNCGYPIIANHVTCPRCGVDVKEQKEILSQKVEGVVEKKVNETILNGTFKCQHCQSEIPLNSLYCPLCGQRVHAPTMTPDQLLNKVVGPTCCLTMLPEDGEVLDKAQKEYVGESVVLNRLNTDESNCTITTQKHAELNYEDGEWYLQNLSEHQTTYLVLNRKIQLQEGDIIIMGNRKFKFERKR